MGADRHVEIVRERPGAKAMVLFIHGILGSPRQFLPYIDRVYDQGYSAAAILLPGHGGDAMAFSRAMLPQWEEYVRRQVRVYAARYERLVIVGHSMGGLLGLNESVEEKARIAGVFMISPPIQINLTPWSIRARARMAVDPRRRQIWRHYMDLASVELSKVLIYPLWIRQFVALKQLIEKTKRMMSRFTVPVCFVHSKKDEEVSLRSSDALERGLVRAEHERLRLEDSWHSWFTDEDVERIWGRLLAFLGKVAPVMT